MIALNDETLTRTGLAPTGAQRQVLIIACGALAREILALIDANGWQHITLTCLPANLHMFPEKICDAVAAAVAKHRPDYGSIFIAYADCGTGGQLFDLCTKLRVEMVKGPHCYSFFEGNAEFSARAEQQIDAFYLTDFLVRQFDAFVVRPLGLDKHPQLRDSYFGNYKTLIYQAQTDDPALDEKARKYAAFLGLEYQRIFTGYGDLADTLKSWAARDRANRG